MSSDLQKYSRQTIFRLVVGVLAILFIIGGGLIYLIYGAAPAAFGLLCLGGALLPVVAISAILKLFEWIVNRYREQ
jgi:hypothetical protein